jgi:hypothetical protein
MLSGAWDLFFSRKSPAAFVAHTIDGAVNQFCIELTPSTADGFHIHPGDLRQQRITAMADLFGLQGHEPPTLLFVQAAEQQIHLMMELAVRMIGRLQAVATLAGMDLDWHQVHPSDEIVVQPL